MAMPKNPSLYQVNTAILLQELSKKLNKKSTLDDIPDSFFDDLKHRGFHYVWFLGVWQKGKQSVAISRKEPSKYKKELPDVTECDIIGSPFAIWSYKLDSRYGDEGALGRLYARLQTIGVRLILDFVPNHVALDHPWTVEHPEYLIQGTEKDLKEQPQNYTKINDKIFAYGRDPYFDGWSDTIQLNYRHQGLRDEMFAILKDIAKVCDGLRCDMAMLLLPRIIQRTWGDKSVPVDGSTPNDSSFWVWVIQHCGIRDGFTMMAEVYWNLEWDLQQQGFDYTYDKKYYDRLIEREVSGLKGHLTATPNFMKHSIRFLENHDEPRVASTITDVKQHAAAAVLAFTVPGLRFFHEGQFQGRKSFVSMHVGRRVDESTELHVENFYDKLLSILKEEAIYNGQWKLINCRQAWDGNNTWNNFICYQWTLDNIFILVCVNYGSTQGQCYVNLRNETILDTAEIDLTLSDMASDVKYVRNVGKLENDGLYLDMHAW
eukprot:CAMPEP_0168532384 /NCGR_PEP_ID=MMETSP0405-20121227/16194_1 /TAXON_ID=498012 /ORGANISM="Trichosphaerium sp, Strain Am-I-7 wt" /LENGTH=487 /DNA_ID=CAMNT_0008557733 /DNA_START=52 /DNA_END=1512 /DNA_ORIENTATION=+